MPTREDAYTLMTSHVHNEGLQKHMLSVEVAMRFYARKYHEDEELWAMTGLLHDFDYERFPTLPDHPLKGAAVLRADGYPDSLIQAILGHAAEVTGVSRDTELARYLFATDELAGFLIAVAYVRPTRKLAEVEVSSVRKKLKDKGFARSVSRDDIVQGAEEIGVSLDDHIAFVLADLKANAAALGV